MEQEFFNGIDGEKNYYNGIDFLKDLSIILIILAHITLPFPLLSARFI